MSPTDAGYDASDPEQVKKAEAAKGLREMASRDVLKAVLSTPAGRNWMWDLLSSCHCWLTTFDPEPLRMAFAEGERNVGLRLLAQISAAYPDALIQMMKEGGQA